MDKVVYLLGAGFSAPLGLPLINNFLMRAKDMYATDAQRFSHFSKVFERIAQMHVTKSYYQTNLFNIEEILSILEMSERVAGSDLREFIPFIKDVIEYYTPAIPKLNLQYSNWWNAPFKEVSGWSAYFSFVGHLLRLRCRKVEKSDHGRKYVELMSEPMPEPEVAYGVISLNYDLVLESMGNLFTLHKSSPSATRFKVNFQSPLLVEDVPLAKLHGSVDSNNIIGPTWNKGLSTGMVAVWHNALDMLAAANHIRIVGYSLPPADAYIKYLLKAAVINSSHLKQIDVLCLDPNGEVKKRYDDFIAFDYYRFRSLKTENYLDALHTETDNQQNREGWEVSFNRLEKIHEFTFSK